MVGELDTTVRYSDELRRSFDTQVFDYVGYLPPPSRLGTGDWRERLQRDMLASFQRAHAERPIDLSLLYVSHQECARETLLAMRAARAVTAVVCGDDKHSYRERPGHPNGQRPLVGAADIHLTNSLEPMRWFAAEGAAVYYFPWAADPLLYRPIDVPKDIPVSFIGGWYGARRELIARLRDDGVDVRCWGPGTENGPVSREEMVRIYSRSRINLGFGGVGDSARITCVKGRDFEVPMSGNLYLTSYDHELAQLFDIGREILCYASWIDCAEQIRYWLDQPERAAEIGRAARARSLRDHTWTRRVSDFLEWRGILRPANQASATTLTSGSGTMNVPR